MINPARAFTYLLAYIAILYLRPQEYVPALAEFPLVPVSLLFAAGLWLAAQPKRFEASQHRLMLGLVSGMFVSTLFGAGFSAATNVVTEFGSTLLLFYLVSTSVDSIQRFRQVCIVLTITSLVMAVHGLNQASNEEGIGWTGATMIEGRIRYIGFLNDPNDLAMAFLMALPLALYVANGAASYIVRNAFRATGALSLYGIYLCNSRGGILGVLAMLLMYSSRRYGLLRSLLVAPILVAPILLLAPSRMSEMSADEESAAGRVDAWFEGFEMFRAHPLLGVGKGMFVDYSWLTAHNSFVLAFAELGMYGYFFWLSILAVSATMLAKIIRWSPVGKREVTLEPVLREVDFRLAPTQWATPGTRPVDEAASTRPPWPDIQRAASALSYSMLGSLVAAFFLSRSYVSILYLLIALIVAIYQMARLHWPTFEPVRAVDMLPRLFAMEVGSIVFLWLLTRVLLATS